MGLIDFSLGDIGKVLKDLREAITGEVIKDPNKQAELLYKLSELEAKALQLQARVVQTEARSEHWITSAWRPITMLSFVFIIVNNYILVPYGSIVFGVTIPHLDIPPDMWDLLKIGLGGYVIGRSVEKVAKTVADRGIALVGGRGDRAS